MCKGRGPGFFVASLLCLVTFLSWAQEPQRVRVGLYVSPPFVMEGEDGQLEGMALELWESIAQRKHLQSEYQVFATLGELLQATEDGSVDVAVTNLTITRERATHIDFTHPWFDAGLRIMVNQERAAGARDVLAGLRESGHLRGYAWLASVVLVMTLLFTLFYRKFDKDYPRRWRDGLAEGFYSVMTMATSGKMTRTNVFGWMGRIWEGLWLVCGIAVVSYITASIASVMTSLSLTSQINGLRDLPGKRVGVFAGSVAEEFMHEQLISARAYPGMDEAVQALLHGHIDAIVGDAPVLQYYLHVNPDKPLLVVGRIFHPDKYAFGLNHQSPLTRPLSVEVIGAQESGEVRRLREKYFGQ